MSSTKRPEQSLAGGGEPFEKRRFGVSGGLKGSSPRRSSAERSAPECRNTEHGAREFSEFFQAAKRDLVLRGPDGDELRARGLMKYWVDLDKDVNDFLLRIEADDFARMKPGVPYQLTWTGDETLRWKVARRLTLTR